MEASGSGAAAAHVNTGAPPRLVAVRGAAANGAPAGRQAGRLVVFLGVADDASSRVAAALLAHRSRGRVRAVSASAATVELDPVVAGSLAEIGVDLARCQTLPPTTRLLELADLVVVMGYDELAPAAARRSEDWCIDDPRGKDADTVRFIRDAIDRRVQRLLIRLGVAVPARGPVMYPAPHAAPSPPCSPGACAPPTATTQSPQSGILDRSSRRTR